jgi:hypothetical protein
VPDAFMPLEPPLLYREMVRYFLRTTEGLATLPLRPGEGDDRHYPANVNICEFLYFAKRANREIDAIESPGRGGADADAASAATQPFLARMDAILAREFPGIPIIKLPALFDAVVDWAEDATVAFTPNPVNMQVINEHVILPRPFGPRMSAEDTVTVLRQVFENVAMPNVSEGLNPRYFAARNMARPVLWMKGWNLHDIAREFSDGFPGRGRAEIEQLIRTANRRADTFTRDGRLRPGWHQVVIPENTVDLFEAYIQIVLESLGLHVHWVDSWSYHVDLGEIHCGTNVKRRPRTQGAVPWWRRTFPSP